MMKAIAVVVALLAVVGVLVVNQPAHAVVECISNNIDALTLELVEVRVDDSSQDTFDEYEGREFLLQKGQGVDRLEFIVFHDGQLETVDLDKNGEGGAQ